MFAFSESTLLIPPGGMPTPCILGGGSNVRYTGGTCFAPFGTPHLRSPPKPRKAAHAPPHAPQVRHVRPRDLLSQGHASWSWPRRLGFSGWRAGAVSACRIGSAGIRATLLAALLLLTSIERVVDLDGAGLSIIFQHAAESASWAGSPVWCRRAASAPPASEPRCSLLCCCSTSASSVSSTSTALGLSTIVQHAAVAEAAACVRTTVRGMCVRGVRCRHCLS